VLAARPIIHFTRAGKHECSIRGMMNFRSTSKCSEMPSSAAMFNKNST
jgi:hypothetical protein